MHEALFKQPKVTEDRTALRGTLSTGPALNLAATAHVDDLKCIGEEKHSTAMISVIEKAVGKVTLQRDNFEHCGIKHESSEHSIIMHQNHYAAQLRPIDEALLGNHSDSVEVNTFNAELVTLFMSLLGGLAWLT